MEYSDEVKKLAETLKSSGLAASMEDALERAHSMIGKKEEEKKIIEEDVAQTTLNGVKEPGDKETIDEPDESPEAQEELKREEVFTNKVNEQQQESSNQKRIDYSKEKKVDLTDVFNVNK